MKLTKAFLVSLGTAVALGLGGYMSIGCASSFGTSPSQADINKYSTSPHFDQKKGVFVNRRPEVIEEMRKRTSFLPMMKDFIFGGDSERVPKEKLPEIKVDFVKFNEPSVDPKVIWFGHSSLLLNIEGKKILIDPVLSTSTGPFGFLMKRFQKPVIELSQLPEVDLIIISHDHYDHLDMDSVKFFKNKKVRFVVPLGVGNHLVGWGIERSRITELDWWQITKLENIEIVATPAQHFSGRSFFKQNQTLWASWVIRGPKQNIYFSADSGYDTHFKAIGDKYGPFDLALLEDGQYNEKWREVHMLPDESIQAFYDLKAKRYFPIHWGMFNLSLHAWYEPIEIISKSAMEKNISLIAPQIGEVVVINDSYVTTPWWRQVNSKIKDKSLLEASK